MRPDQNRGDASLSQIHQQFVQLNREEPFFGHGIQIAVQAVDNDDPGVVPLDGDPYSVDELSRRQFDRINLLQRDVSGMARRKSQLTGDRVGSDPDGCGSSTRARFPRLPTSPSWRRAPHWRSSVCSSAARHPTYDEALRETNRVELVVRQIPERGRHAWGSTARNNTSCLTAEVYRGPAISRQLQAIQRSRAKSVDFRLI